jgi:1,4-dihydroxy-2-naphthoate octaprenyltransferase
MATVAQWIEGARPRTLPNAIAPVIAGTPRCGGKLFLRLLFPLR